MRMDGGTDVVFFLMNMDNRQFAVAFFDGQVFIDFGFLWVFLL